LISASELSKHLTTSHSPSCTYQCV
jgi:hypothetical protein